MEDLPYYCTNCNKMGHNVIQCKPPIPKRKRNEDKLKKGKEKIWIPVDATKTNVAMNEDARDDPENLEDKAGQDVISNGFEVDNIVDLTVATLPISTLCGGDVKMVQFFTNLGQFLECFQRQEEGAPIASFDQQIHSVRTQEKLQELRPSKQDGELALTVMNRAEVLAGEACAVMPLLENVNLAVEETVEEERRSCSAATAAADPTTNFGEGEIVEGELESALSGKQMGSIVIDLTGVSWKNIPCKAAGPVPPHLDKTSGETSEVNTVWEDGEPSSVFRVKSTSDLAQLEIETASEYEADENGFDRWTENSYEEEPEDVFSQFLSKMEKARNPPKQTKYMELIANPKSVADFAHNFSRQNLEDEKKRKYGTSDRVLRSMQSAFNTDPFRAGSL